MKVGWAKARQRRAHRSDLLVLMSELAVGTRFALCPPHALRLTIITAHSEQSSVLPWLLALQPIKRFVGLLQCRALHFRFYLLDLIGCTLQLLNGFFGRFFSFGERQNNFVEPAKLPAVTRHLGNYPMLHRGIARIVHRVRRRNHGAVIAWFTAPENGQ